MRLKLNSVCSKSKFILDVRGAELLSHLPQFAFQSQFISFSIQTKLNSLNLFYGGMDLKTSFFKIKLSNNCLVENIIRYFWLRQELKESPCLSVRLKGLVQIWFKSVSGLS